VRAQNHISRVARHSENASIAGVFSVHFPILILLLPGRQFLCVKVFTSLCHLAK